MLRLLERVLRFWNRELYAQELLVAALIAVYCDEENVEPDRVREYFSSDMFSRGLRDLVGRALAQIDGAKQDLRERGVEVTRTAVRRLLIERLMDAVQYDVEKWIGIPF